MDSVTATSVRRRTRAPTQTGQLHKTEMQAKTLISLVAVGLTIVVVALLSSMSAWASDCLVIWDANAQEEAVARYAVVVDGIELVVNAPETSARCSQFVPSVDPMAGHHTAQVFAENDYGRSTGSAIVPFGPPKAPAGVYVRPTQ